MAIINRLQLFKSVEEDLKYCIENNAFLSCNELLENASLTEETKWESYLKRRHYDDHVCKKDEEYTGEVDESGLRIKFPYMTMPTYLSRAERFTSNFNVGPSNSDFNRSESYGWQTEFGWFRGKVCIKFRKSDLDGPRQDGLIEYVAYVLVRGNKLLTATLAGYPYSYYEVEDRKIISYGLCTSSDPHVNFDKKDELPPTERTAYTPKVPPELSTKDALRVLSKDKDIDKETK